MGRVGGRWVGIETQHIWPADRVKIGEIVGNVMVIEHINANSVDKSYVFGLDTNHGRVGMAARRGQVMKVWRGSKQP